MKTLILGGVRSGKSRMAETIATRSGLPVTLIATATAQDDEMRARIAAHRARRSPDWIVIEEPVSLATTLAAQTGPGRCVIVDCLTLWLTHLLCLNDEARCAHERAALLEVLPALPGHIVIVANESGLGITPLGELTRRFLDEAGVLHQQLAGLSDNVLLTVAGLPALLKGKMP